MKAYAVIWAPGDHLFDEDATLGFEDGKPVTWEAGLEVGTVSGVEVVLDGRALEVAVELNAAGERLIDLHSHVLRNMSFLDEVSP